MPVELPLEGDVVAVDNRLANHLPFQVRHCIDKQLDDFDPGGFPADFGHPYGRVEKLSVLGKVLRRGIGVVFVPGTHVGVDDFQGLVFVRRHRELGKQQNDHDADKAKRDSLHGISSSIIAVVGKTEISFALARNGLAWRRQFHQRPVDR
ncbi:hypothetical protein D3C79_873400 [compost metagenome]